MKCKRVTKARPMDHSSINVSWPTQSKGNTQRLELREDVSMGKTEGNIYRPRQDGEPSVLEEKRMRGRMVRNESGKVAQNEAT